MVELNVKVVELVRRKKILVRRGWVFYSLTKNKMHNSKEISKQLVDVVSQTSGGVVIGERVSGPDSHVQVNNSKKKGREGRHGRPGE